VGTHFCMRRTSFLLLFNLHTHAQYSCDDQPFILSIPGTSRIHFLYAFLMSMFRSSGRAAAKLPRAIRVGPNAYGRKWGGLCGGQSAPAPHAPNAFPLHNVRLTRSATTTASLLDTIQRIQAELAAIQIALGHASPGVCVRLCVDVWLWLWLSSVCVSLACLCLFL